MAERKLPTVARALDSAIETVAPTWAARRARSRAILNMARPYAGADSGRIALSGWLPSAGDADADLITDLPMLRRRSRDLARNSPLAGGAISTMVTNVVGTGLRPIPQIDQDFLGLSDEQTKAWKTELMREWRLFADCCEIDITRQQSFAGLQDLVFRSSLASGDVFVVFRSRDRDGSPYRTKLQLVEGDRVDNPWAPVDGFDSKTTTAGIQSDEDGAPVRYWIRRRHPGALLTAADTAKEWDSVLAFGRNSGRRQVLHIYRKLRPGQNRGEPFLSPVIETIKQLGRYTDAEIMAAVVNSCFAVTLKTETGAEADFGSSSLQDGRSEDIQLVDPGQITNLQPNESLESFTPARPNTAFEAFWINVMRMVGIGLEIPHEILTKHYTASYSASRAAMLEAWRMFRTRRSWLVASLCQPVWDQFMAEGVSRGRIFAPGFWDDELIQQAWSGVKWIGPAPGQIDPRREVEAATKRVEGLLSTREREIMEMTGEDYLDVHQQLVREKEMRIKDGLEPDPADLAQAAAGNPQLPGPEDRPVDEPDED